MRAVPGGGGGLSGRLIWGAVDEILVSSEPVRNHVTTVMHMPAGKVRVKPGAQSAAPATGPARFPPPADLPPWQGQGPVDWASLSAQVRERAAAERARLARGGPNGEL
jgi:hypothetical protein